MSTFIKARARLILVMALILPGLMTLAQDYQVRIAFIGNSITYGAGLPNPSAQSYPAQLGEILKESFGDTCEIRNFAISSRTMLKNGDYPIWNDPEFDQALAFKPNIVVIALGTNDTKPQNWDEFGGEFLDDYRSMIDTFRRNNPYVELFLCYPPPAFEVVWGIRDSVIVHGVIPVVDQLLAETDSRLIDFYTPLLDSVRLFPDFIHPDVQGSAEMAGIVNERFTETDVIRQVERGLTFITSLESDRKYITKNDSTGLLTWTTINATFVHLDGTEVGLTGSLQVDHTMGTSHTLIASGKKHSDTLVYQFVYYTPVLEHLSLSASEKSFFTEDTIEISALLKDQYNYPLNDTLVDIQWSINIGKGILFAQADNKVYFTSSEASLTFIQAQHMSLKGGITLKVNERDYTSIDDPDRGFPLEVFPNPFDDHLNFSISQNGSGKVNLKIIDMQGKTHIRRSFTVAETGLIKIDTEQLPEGLYLFELNRGKHKYSGKLVK